MSGHSKWSNIKHTKEKSDAERGKIFTKLGRELAVIVKQGGSDPNTNSRLKDAIAKAKQSNMPNDTIMRSIKKASGELGNINYEEMTYEGYGIQGAAVIVRCLTDNKNRTAGDIRHLFDKYGGSLGSNGCVSYLFKNYGILTIENKNLVLDDLMLDALEFKALDVIDDDDTVEILTEPTDLTFCKEELEKKGYIISLFEVRMVPLTTIKLDYEKLVKFNIMIEKLEDLDDVLEVFHNVEVFLNDEI